MEDIIWKDHEDYADLMTIEEWLENVKSGLLIDYDGHGYLATEEKESNVWIEPSQGKEILEENKDLGATHIMWYNR